MRVSVKCDLEKIAKRIYVGSANKPAPKKLMSVYLHAARVRAPGTAAGQQR